jgi:hypothetical protein
MSFPAELKKELVLSFKYRRIGTVWKLVHDKPEVLRLSNQDCSQAYGDPVLVWRQGRTVVEARIHDGMGIDIANAGSFLGDWTRAKCRCEELLAITPQPTDAAA